MEEGSIIEISEDERRLNELGYKSELKREFSPISTIAFAFSIMGVIASVSSTLSFGLAGGGHVGIGEVKSREIKIMVLIFIYYIISLVWGWFVPGVPVILLSMSMAELASAMPTSGGVRILILSILLFDYSNILVHSFITGQLNLLPMNGLHLQHGLLDMLMS